MASLHVLQGPDKGRTFQTNREAVILGRNAEQIPINDNTVSRRHAQLVPSNGTWMIADLNSSNGTYVNGHRLETAMRLKHGDQIKVGSTLLVFGGDESVERFSGPTMTRDLLDLDAAGRQLDASILAASASSEDSVILAAPETADAVHAWKLIFRLAETIGTVTDPKEFLERVADTIFDHFTVDRCFILLRDPQTGTLEPQVVRWRLPAERDGQKISTSRTIINHVLQKREGVLCANAMTDQRFAENSRDDSIHRMRLHSVICVPILTHDDVHGIIHMDCSMHHHTYTHQQMQLAATIGRMAGLAIENAQLLASRMRNERLAATGETVAYLSHHIRNILQGIRSGADVLEMGLKRNNLENIRSGWQIMRRNLDRTYQLATNMLAFSKQRVPNIEMAQLNRVVEEVVELAQRHADDRHVMLLPDLDELPPIPLDVDGIHQAVLNIVTNAVDAAPADSGRVLVKTSFDPAAGDALVTIQDNGPGIAPESLSVLFEPFHSTKGQRGTGLGLAAARKVVTELGGRIEVRSRPGEGTTFTVHLPTSARAIDSDKTHGPAPA
ncbi:MAG TPA: ATP-binding protein [Phycisphaerae bacterium]